MPQKQKVTKKGTAWKTGRGQRAVYTEVPRVYDAVGGTEDINFSCLDISDIFQTCD